MDNKPDGGFPPIYLCSNIKQQKYTKDIKSYANVKDFVSINEIFENKK